MITITVTLEVQAQTLADVDPILNHLKQGASITAVHVHDDSAQEPTDLSDIGHAVIESGDQIECHTCSKKVNPVVKVVPFKNGNGYHHRADCPVCGKFIKFLKQS